MKNPLVKIKEHQFILSAHKTIYWQNKKTLLISDLHLGKGINAQAAYSEKLAELENAISEFDPNRIIILGDLFDAKSTVDRTPLKNLFKELQKEIVLVLGNHDILDSKIYKDLGINTILNELKEDMFLFTHKPVKSERVNIHGHLHPAVIVKNEKQPCFVFKLNSICLPPFGGITGKCIFTPSKLQKTYYVDEDLVQQLRSSK